MDPTPCAKQCVLNINMFSGFPAAAMAQTCALYFVTSKTITFDC